MLYEDIECVIRKNNKKLAEYMQETKIKTLENNLAELTGKPIPHQELNKNDVDERNTWLYGYGFCSRDDREIKDLQEGKLIF